MQSVDLIYLLKIVPIISVGIGCYGVYLAIKRGKKLNKTLEQNNKLEQKIDKLQETTYLGTFPSYLNDVINLLESAHSDIQITTPVLATGYLTSNKQWDKYKTTILQQGVNNLDIKFIVYDKSRRIEYALEKHGEKYNIFKDSFSRTTKSGIKLSNSSNLYKIQNSIEECHEEVSKSIFKKFKINYTNKPITIFSWIIDMNKNPEAIFVISDEGKNNSEVAFRTKDMNLIKSLSNISNQLFQKDELKNIRPLYSSVYEGTNIIRQSALDFMSESNIVQALGTIDALHGVKDDSYKTATRSFINNVENSYYRIANFRISSSNKDDKYKVLRNIEFFHAIKKLGSKNLYIYHNSEIAKGFDDFHFRINQNKVVIRIGGKYAKKNSAIVIPDHNVKYNFIDYYNSIRASLKSRRLEIKQLERIEDILSQNENLNSIRAKLNSYLENLPIRIPFNNSLDISNLIIPISSISNLLDSELYNFCEVFNRYGFAVLSIKNGGDEKYYKDGGLQTLDSDMESLKRFFGNMYTHERSKNFRVDIKLGNDNRGAYMGTTSESYPPHTDGVYDKIPPKVVTMFALKPCEKGLGASTIVSGKAVYNFITKNCKEVEGKFFSHQFKFSRLSTHSKRRFFENISGEELIKITYRNDREVKMTSNKNKEFDNALDLVHEFVNNPENIFKLHLKKGQILVLDNSAVLHGRQGFHDPGRWLLRYSFLGREKKSQKFVYGFSKKAHY